MLDPIFLRRMSRRATSIQTSLFVLCAVLCGPVAQAADRVASTAPSWVQSIPAGTWSSISTNTIASVDPRNDSTVNPNYPNAPQWGGNTGQAAVLSAWNGGAIATGFGAKGSLIAWGGGHQDYYGNEVYTFDLSTRAWSRVSNPYKTPGFPVTNGLWPDGSPSVPHTYAMVAYHPGTNSFITLRTMTSNSPSNVTLAAMFDFTSRSWRHSPANSSDTTASGGWAVYDQSRDVIWGEGGYPSAAFAKFNPNTNNGNGTYGSWTNYPAKLQATMASADRDPAHDILVVAAFGQGSNIYGIDLANPSAAAVQLVQGGTPPSRSDSAGFAWSDSRQAFIYWRSGGDVYELKLVGSDWKTGTWTWGKLTSSSNSVVPQDQSNGIFNRFRLVRYDDAEVAVVVNQVSGPVYAFNIPGGSTAAAPVTPVTPTSPAPSAPTTPQPTASITSSAASVAANSNVTLTWASANATACTASGGWSGSKATSGTQSVGPLSSATTFTLTCTNTAGSANASTSVTIAAASAPASGTASADFQARASQPGVLRAIQFNSSSDVYDHIHPDGAFPASGSGWDTNVKASGNGSLRFTVPALSGSNSSGAWKLNFTDNLETFGAGEDFYVQWRQRFDSNFINTHFAGSGGWKTIIVGEGDVAGQTEANSCTELELVVSNLEFRNYAQMYHNCGVYKGLYERYGSYDFKMQNGMPSPYCLYSDNNGTGCFKFYPNEWMTFQIHVRPGPRGTATGSLESTSVTGFTNSVVEMWAAREGQPSVLIHSWTGVVLHETRGKEYGKIWLTPYQTGKDPAVSQAVSNTWYDEIIISRNRIADPMAGQSAPVPRPPDNVTVR